MVTVNVPPVQLQSFLIPAHSPVSACNVHFTLYSTPPWLSELQNCGSFERKAWVSCSRGFPEVTVMSCPLTLTPMSLIVTGVLPSWLTYAFSQVLISLEPFPPSSSSSSSSSSPFPPSSSSSSSSSSYSSSSSSSCLYPSWDSAFRLDFVNVKLCPPRKSAAEDAITHSKSAIRKNATFMVQQCKQVGYVPSFYSAHI